jgi:hypothetical protein
VASSPSRSSTASRLQMMPRRRKLPPAHQTQASPSPRPASPTHATYPTYQ